MIPTANHTVECVLDCQYFYGSAGSIIDARGVARRHGAEAGRQLDRRATRRRASARAAAATTCARSRRASCSPPASRSPSSRSSRRTAARPSTRRCSTRARRPSSCTPPAGRARASDKFLLTGGEENFTRPLRAQRQRVLRLQRRQRAEEEVEAVRGPAHQVEPAGNGVYADGKPVAGALGCSVHWFQEHQSFKNGGLVALSRVRGRRALPADQPRRRDHRAGLLPRASAARRRRRSGRGKDDVLYSIDYQRGIDILRWKGEHYVPGKGEKGRRARDERPAPPRQPRRRACSDADRTGLVAQLRAQGWSPGFCQLIAGREDQR